MQLLRRGLTGQRYELVADDGAAWGDVRLHLLRQAGTVQAVDGRCWQIERDPGFGPWQTRDAADGAGAPLVTTVKGFGRERYELAYADGAVRLVRRHGFFRRRMELLDAGERDIGEVLLASMWTGAYELRLPPLPDAVTATLAFVVVLLNRRDNAATWS